MTVLERLGAVPGKTIGLAGRFISMTATPG
jgi:hypothetical protein